LNPGSSTRQQRIVIHRNTVKLHCCSKAAVDQVTAGDASARRYWYPHYCCAAGGEVADFTALRNVIGIDDNVIGIGIPDDVSAFRKGDLIASREAAVDIGLP
jgi:hypothetical protein